VNEEEQGLDLAKEGVKQLLEPVTDIMKSLLGPSAAEIGFAWRDSFRVWRVKRSVRLLQDAQQFASAAGLQLKAVAPRLLFPILESASLQDDEDLQARWAALLANAATSPNSVHPSFIEILRQLTPDDARLLDKLSDYCKEKRTRRVSPWVGPISYAEREKRVAEGDNSEAAFDNLVLLGLIEVVYTIDSSKIKVSFTQGRSSKFDGKLDSHHELTESADTFVKACRAPKTINA
jgi:hypothetical protein